MSPGILKTPYYPALLCALPNILWFKTWSSFSSVPFRLKNELKEGAFLQGGQKNQRKQTPNTLTCLSTQKYYPKPGPTFIMIQSGLLSVEIGGWVICPHFIAHQAWEALPDLSSGYWTCGWPSFKTAVTADSLSRQRPLCVPVINFYFLLSWRTGP